MVEVTGATTDIPVCSLNAFLDTTKAGRRFIISLPLLGSKSSQTMSPLSGV